MFFFTIGFSRFDMDLTSDIPEKCVTFTIWKTHGSGKTVWNISLKIIFHHLFETFCPLKKGNDLWLTLCSFALKREVSLKKHPTWAFEKISGEERSLMHWADWLCPHFKGTMVSHVLLEQFLAQKLKKRHCHCTADHETNPDRSQSWDTHTRKIYMFVDIRFT